jgi:hypothetical protein
VQQASRTIARVAVYPGARRTDAVPQLEHVITWSTVPGYTVARTRWWTAAGTTPGAVARWYAAHPTAGFASEDGPGSTSGTGLPLVFFDDFRPPGEQKPSPVGIHIHVQTTATSAGVGIRVTVEVVWPPARPAASYVTDVDSIDVQVTTTRLNPHPTTSRRSYTITSADQVDAIVQVFNGLKGSPPFVLNCPAIMKTVVYRIVFHSTDGDLVARSDVGCADTVSVSRDGRTVPPGLGGLAGLEAAAQR